MMENYTSPWLNDELNVLQDAVRCFYEKEFAPQYERWMEQGMVDRDAWNKAGEMGILCASIPEEYGGGGGSFAHDAVIIQEQSRAGIIGFSNAVHSCVLAHYILAYGTEVQKRNWLPKMASGEVVGAIAMTEPGAGSDLGGITTSARRVGDHYIINGSKTFITNGFHANLICIAVKTDTAAGHRGISLIMLETDGVEGFSRGLPLKKLGTKVADTTELFFDNVRVPVANLLGNEEGKGFSQLMNQLPRERMIIAIKAVTMMERAIEAAVQHVKERKVFGKRLLDFQNTRFKLAECQTHATIARIFVDHCVAKELEGALDIPTAAMAKWWPTQKACEVVDECLQLFGGYGYMLEYPISGMYVDARLMKIYGGTNEIMKEVIAREL